MAKHRRASKSVRYSVLASVAGAAIAVPLLSATSASAASVATWDAVAQCESSGNWQNHDSGGNGHYGGLQFSTSSWLAAGGGQYASRADYATKDQQIAVAEKLLAMQGPGAWQCAGAGGLTAGGPAANVNPNGSGSTTSAPAPSTATIPAPGVGSDSSAKQAAPQAKTETPAPAPAADNVSTAPVQQGNGNYTVKSGDTLSQIAASHHVVGGWQKLFNQNKDIVKDANLIFPGQKLHIG